MTIDQIARSISDEMGVPLDAMTGRNRTTRVQDARRKAIRRAYDTGHTTQEISDYFGRALATVHQIYRGNRMSPDQREWVREDLWKLMRDGRERTTSEIARRLGLIDNHMAAFLRAMRAEGLITGERMSLGPQDKVMIWRAL